MKNGRCNYLPEFLTKSKKPARFAKYCGFTGRPGCRALMALFLIVACGPLTAACAPHQAAENEVPIAGSADLPGNADFCWIDELVEEAIGEGQLPGAVILVGRNDQILYRKAFGHRAVVPALEPMTVDTIFDLASLTKVVATTTSIMKLIEAGRISLEDPVAKYIPNFERHGKSEITVRHLLTHMSGLRPGFNPARQWQGYQAAIEQIGDDVPVTAPGERIVYSDLNFVLLGEIVRRVSGMPLDQFAQQHIFKPLGMRDTMYNPPANAAVSNCADRTLRERFSTLPGPGWYDASRAGSRSRCPPHGRRGGARRALQHSR